MIFGLNTLHVYIAGAIAWLFIQTHLTIQQMSDHPGHPLRIAIRWCRAKGLSMSPSMGVLFRILCVIPLATVGFLFSLLLALAWPASITVYILMNICEGA